MTRILCNFALMGLAVDATSHYSKPPCQSDEVELQVKDYETNYTGKVCAPACGDNDACPTDKPQFVSVHPKCLLHDSGKKYCGLKCFVGCGSPTRTHMTCFKVDKTTRVCGYREEPTPPTPPTPPKAKPCCQGHCADSSKAKYYSIAKSLFGKKHCGECCLDPKKYDLFHFFESNLTKADNDSPCKAFGYTTYDSTDTHGFGPVSVTLDLYNLPTDSIEQALPTPAEIEKLACELASKKMIEDKATSEVCAVIAKKVKIPDCQAIVEKLWDRIVAKCPKGLEAIVV